MENIHERLRYELNRLKLKPAEAARLAGENDSQGIRDVLGGRKRLSVELLSELSKVGVDVLYIVTGQRTPGISSMSDSETQLLENYRVADDKAKYIIEQTSAAFVAAKDKEVSRTG